jgi:hypothetical protein
MQYIRENQAAQGRRPSVFSDLADGFSRTRESVSEVVFGVAEQVGAGLACGFSMRV